MNSSIPKLAGLVLLSAGLQAAGVVAVVQPRLAADDYRTSATFQAALEPYFDSVRTNSSSAEPVLVVLPEYVGTWLVAAEEWGLVFRAGSQRWAMVGVLLHHPWEFLKALVHSIRCTDTSLGGHLKRALFLSRAAAIRDNYQSVFAALARSYRCWLVAGSVILPEAEVGTGQIVFSTTCRLMNQSFVFNPQGEVVLVAQKGHPLEAELNFLDPAPVGGLGVVETELGRLGVLVCADSWYPDGYARLREQKVEIIAVPSFVTPAESWEAPWRGYDPPGGEPGDVDRGDIGIQAEKTMWERYAVCSRMDSSGARLGVNSFLVGDFWGLSGAGQSTIAGPEGLLQKSEHPLGEAVLIHHLDQRQLPAVAQ